MPSTPRENQENTFNGMDLLPEDETDPKNIKLSDRGIPKLYDHQGKLLPIILMDDDKPRVITAIGGREISRIDPKNMVVYIAFTGIAYFEDSPSTPNLMLEGSQITHIDDLDLSEVQEMSIERNAGDLSLRITKNGQTFQVTANKDTLENNKLSQKKTIAKEKFKEKISVQKGITISIDDSMEFYRDQENVMEKIEQAIDSLTREEINLLTTEHITILFYCISVEESLRSNFMRINSSNSAEQMSQSIKRLLKKHKEHIENAPTVAVEPPVTAPGSIEEAPTTDVDALPDPDDNEEDDGLAAAMRQAMATSGAPTPQPPAVVAAEPQVAAPAPAPIETPSANPPAAPAAIDDESPTSPLSPEVAPTPPTTPQEVRLSIRERFLRSKVAKIIYDLALAGALGVLIDGGGTDFTRPTPVSAQAHEEIIEFDSLREAMEKGYVIDINGEKYAKKGYDWALPKEERKKLPKTDPRRYSLKVEIKK
jgi:hypothetical protein